MSLTLDDAGPMFRKRKPCRNCPCREEDGHAFMLPEDRIDAILGGKTFLCHETVNTHPGAPAINPWTQHCAGAMALLRKVEQPNQIMQTVTREFGYSPFGEIDGTEVYDSVEEMKEAHKIAREIFQSARTA